MLIIVKGSLQLLRTSNLYLSVLILFAECKAVCQQRCVLCIRICMTVSHYMLFQRIACQFPVRIVVVKFCLGMVNLGRTLQAVYTVSIDIIGALVGYISCSRRNRTIVIHCLDNTALAVVAQCIDRIYIAELAFHLIYCIGEGSVYCGIRLDQYRT